MLIQLLNEDILKNIDNPYPKFLTIHCFFCDKVFDKKTSEIKKTKRSFCSQTCAAKFNNTNMPKKQLQGECKYCQKKIPKSLKKCKNCKEKFYYKNNYLIIDENLPISSLFDKGLRAGKYAKIRFHARKKYLSKFKPICIICGYSHHVEISHIKDIASYDPSTPLAIVNHINNLAGLCRNCHWELDHNILKKEEVINKITSS